MADAPTAERALPRMRRYTTLSMVAVVLLFTALIAVASPEPWLLAGVLVAGALVTVQYAFWEHLPPLWAWLPALLLSVAVWIACIGVYDGPLVAVLPALSIAQLVSIAPRRRRVLAAGLGLVPMLAPIGIVALIRPEPTWPGWVTTASFAYVAALSLILLNAYGWGLYLQLDEARRASAELAVAKERYRFATDLHDIQGHTLHVIRLKTRLAQKLLDRDPAAARAQLVEADELIGETLANTRSLAFGERRVSLASELANAGELLAAAGIRWTVDGTADAAASHELLGLVVRETTTNILRHAQPTEVTVTVAPGRLRIENDGSKDTTRPLSGLARLAERFEAEGGVLRTTRTGDRFVTDAELP